MKVLDVKLDGTSVKFYDDFTDKSNKSDNIKYLEQMLNLVLSSLVLVN